MDKRKSAMTPPAKRDLRKNKKESKVMSFLSDDNENAGQCPYQTPSDEYGSGTDLKESNQSQVEHTFQVPAVPAVSFTIPVKSGRGRPSKIPKPEKTEGDTVNILLTQVPNITQKGKTLLTEASVNANFVNNTMKNSGKNDAKAAIRFSNPDPNGVTKTLRFLDEGNKDSDSDCSSSRIKIHATPLDVKPADYDGVKLPCLLDANMDGYRKLQNSHQDPKLSVLLSESGNMPSLTYLKPLDLTWMKIYPGILLCVTFKSGNVKTGFMRLDARTVKPLEQTKDNYVLLSVIQGNIRVKSSGFEFDKDGVPFLQPVSLVEGSYIIVPKGSMYSIENWMGEEANLHFTIIRPPQQLSKAKINGS